MKRLYHELSDEENQELREEDPRINETKKLLDNRNKESIKTYCRIRPIESELGLFKICENDRRNLIINPPEEDRIKIGEKLTFTHIFDSRASQIEVFQSACLNIVEDLVQNRKSGLVFAFGLTNSGKTYTITGKPENPGILPLSLIQILAELQKIETRPELLCNYVEIYNEEVFDLLADEKCKKKVHIKEKDKTFYIKDVTDKRINSIQELNDSLNQGIIKKTMAATSLNPESSRSHTIFKIILRWYNDYSNPLNDEEYEEASLSIVDLAGSERQHRAETSGKEFQQARKINQSLLTLGLCFKVMKDNSMAVPHNRKIVPFRDSKLTKLFQQYLTAEDVNIIMITNISPSKEDFKESCNTLQYACTAREIKPIRSRVDHTNSQFNNNLKNRKKKLDNITNFTGITNNNSNNVTQSNLFSSDNSSISEDEFKSFNNILIEENPQGFNQNVDSKFRRSIISMPVIYSHPNLIYPVNNNFAEEINEMKHNLQKMSKRFRETQDRCEMLEEKNLMLSHQIIQLKYQFDLQEINCKYEILKTMSGQMYTGHTYDKYRNILENPNVSSINREIVMPNPLYKSPVKIESKVSIGKLFSSKNNIIEEVDEDNKEIHIIEEEVDNINFIKNLPKEIQNEKEENNNIVISPKKQVTQPREVIEEKNNIVISTKKQSLEVIKPEKIKENKKKSKRASELKKEEEMFDTTIASDIDNESEENENKQKKTKKKNIKKKKEEIKEIKEIFTKVSVPIEEVEKDEESQDEEEIHFKFIHKEMEKKKEPKKNKNKGKKTKKEKVKKNK